MNKPTLDKPLKKEIFLFINSLTGLLKSLEQEYTIIDLQNESSITGKIIYVDGFMNVDLEDVVFYNSRGSKHHFEKFFVKGRLIRFVHIPKHLSPLELYIKNVKKPTVHAPKKVFTFKRKRAQRYHDEIVQYAFGKPEQSKTN